MRPQKKAIPKTTMWNRGQKKIWLHLLIYAFVQVFNCVQILNPMNEKIRRGRFSKVDNLKVQIFSEGKKKFLIFHSSFDIRMSHWHQQMVDGSKSWISCKWLKALRKASQWQLIKCSAPSTIWWCQCDIGMSTLMENSKVTWKKLENAPKSLF